MGTALTGNTIASSYLGLIKSTDSLAIGTSAKRITDGAGNDLPIKLTTTQMFFNVGTVTAPALSFDGNISEGFYIPTDENIGVCIAGSEIARFNGTGISLTSSKLTLDNDQKIRWTSDDVYIQGTTSADNIQLGVGGSTQFTFAQTTGLRLHQYGGGSITGTVTQRLGVTSTGQVVEIPIGAGALDGSGTAGKLAKFTDSDTLGDSILSESSTVITNTGVFNISNGTAGNPAYSFTDATNTGMFRDGTNLKFSLAGVVGLSIDGNSDTVINKNLKLSDAFKIKLGDSDDVEIYHDTNSFIENSTGYLMLKSDTAIYLRSKTGNQPYINAIKGAEVSLFFNDSQKFETTNTGVKTTGQGIFTGFVAIGGTSPDESLHITNSSGANIILNSDANTADSGIYMSEGADATPTQNGAYLHYDASANEFKIATGGGSLTDRFTIARDTGDSTFAGSVSILKSSLGGTTAMSDGTLIFGAGSTNYFSFRLDASADLHLDKSFSSASSTVLTIDRSTSNIGIGITSPIVPFHVVGTAVNNPSNGNGGYEVMQVFDDTSYATGVGGGIGFGGNFTSSNSTIFSEIRGIKENATDNNYAGALTFSTRANGGSITERLRINSSGNSLFQGGINLQDSGTNKVWLTRAETILGGSDDDFLIYTETGLNIRLYTSGNERLRVDSSGNVGIGTTSPDVKAHIFGGSDSQENVMLKVQSNGVANDGSLSTSILLANSTGLTSIHGAKISAIRTSSSTDDLTFSVFSTSMQERLRITSAGNVGIGTDTPDARFSAVASSANSTIARIGGLEYSGNQRGLTIKTFQSNGGDDCGVEFNAAEGLSGYGSFIFKADTSERMRINSSGNIGIGTTSPTSDAIVRFIEIEDSTSAGIVLDAPRVFSIFSSSSSTLVFRDETAGATRMTLDSSGNLGIGTTNPTGLLHVYGDTNSNGGELYLQINNNNTTDNIGTISFGNNVGVALSRIQAQTSGANNNSNLAFFTSTGATRTQKMVITNDGKVGINDTSPFTNLSISDATSTTGFGSNDSYRLSLRNTDTTNNNYALISFNDGDAGAGAMGLQFIDHTNNYGDLTFITRGADGFVERQRILSDGDIIIGGTAFQAQGALSVSPNHDTGASVVLFNRANSGTSSQVLRFQDDGSTKGSVSYDNVSTSFNTSSDYRLKEDLKDFNALDIASTIKMYDFKWKEADSRSYGVMAHELQEVLPQAVSGDKDAEEMQQVDYSKLVPILLKSIQELEARVQELEKEI